MRFLPETTTKITLTKVSEKKYFFRGHTPDPMDPNVSKDALSARGSNDARGSRLGDPGAKNSAMENPPTTSAVDPKPAMESDEIEIENAESDVKMDSNETNRGKEGASTAPGSGLDPINVNMDTGHAAENEQNSMGNGKTENGGKRGPVGPQADDTTAGGTAPGSNPANNPDTKRKTPKEPSFTEKLRVNRELDQSWGNLYSELKADGCVIDHEERRIIKGAGRMDPAGTLHRIVIPLRLQEYPDFPKMHRCNRAVDFTEQVITFWHQWKKRKDRIKGRPAPPAPGSGLHNPEASMSTDNHGGQSREDDEGFTLVSRTKTRGGEGSPHPKCPTPAQAPPPIPGQGQGEA